MWAMRSAEERKAALSEFNGMYPMKVVEEFLEEATRERFSFLYVNMLAPPREEALFFVRELLSSTTSLNRSPTEMHRAPRRGGGFFRDTLFHIQRMGRNADNFMRQNGPRIRDIAQIVAPLLAAEAPALAAGVATAGQGLANYATLRDQLDRR